MSAISSASSRISSRARSRTEALAFQARERAHRKTPHSLDPRRHSKKTEARVGKRSEIRHVFDDRDAGAEQDRVRGAAAILVVIDVERIDPDERRARLREILSSVFREEGMLAAGVSVGAPVGVPAGMDEDSLRFYIALLEVHGIDRAFR